MKITRPLFALLLVLGLVGHGPALAAEKYRIVAGTELIADIVRDLLPDMTELLALVPAASCPGHHDMRASDMAFFTRADLIIIHKWQRGQAGIDDAIGAAQLAPHKLKIMENRGSLLVPAKQLAASVELEAFLAQLPGVDRDALARRLAARMERIDKLARQCMTSLAPHARLPALSAAMQEEFVAWMGLHPVASYGRAEDMPPGLLMELAKKGREQKVRIVIDNMQSGAEAGLPLARELGVPHVAFSNFPMFSAETPDYESLLTHNTQMLNQALKAGSREP